MNADFGEASASPARCFGDHFPRPTCCRNRGCPMTSPDQVSATQDQSATAGAIDPATLNGRFLHGNDQSLISVHSTLLRPLTQRYRPRSCGSLPIKHQCSEWDNRALARCHAAGPGAQKFHTRRCFCASSALASQLLTYSGESSASQASTRISVSASASGANCVR